MARTIEVDAVVGASAGAAVPLPMGTPAMAVVVALDTRQCLLTPKAASDPNAMFAQRLPLTHVGIDRWADRYASTVVVKWLRMPLAQQKPDAAQRGASQGLL